MGAMCACPLTLICLKPAFSNFSLTDLTAWKALIVNTSTIHSYFNNIRVGEALTKDRKSSAAASEGLVDIARAHDRTRVVEAGATARVKLGCSSECRRDTGVGM